MEEQYEVTVDEQTGEQTVENTTPEPQPQQLPDDYVEDDPVGVYPDYENEENQEERVGEEEDEPEEGEDPDELTDEISHNASEADELTDEISHNASEADDVASFLAEKGVSYDELVQTYTNNGTLTDAQYDKLKEAGIPRSMVDSYCQGQIALYERWCEHVKGYAGGEQGYSELMQYAAQTLNSREKAAYDEAVNSGDVDRARIAVEALLYRYQQDNPQYEEAEYEGYSAPHEPPIQGFTSPEEAYAMQEDPRMYTDPQFAALFNARLMRTPFLVNN